MLSAEPPAQQRVATDNCTIMGWNNKWALWLDTPSHVGKENELAIHKLSFKFTVKYPVEPTWNQAAVSKAKLTQAYAKLWKTNTF